MKATKGTELLLTTENKVGKLEEIAKAIKDNGISIRAMSAWAFDDKAYFRLVASDNAKTKQILQKLGSVEEKDVIIVDMPDEVGQLFRLASKLKEHNIDIHHIYGTAPAPKNSALIIFSSGDNAKALKVSSS